MKKKTVGKDAQIAYTLVNTYLKIFFVLEWQLVKGLRVLILF